MNDKVIMLIDDSEVDNYINKLIIQTEKISNDIVVLETVDKAMSYFASENFKIPDLILLDINLPAKSGYDFLTNFERLPEKVRGKTTIIILSSSDKDEDVEQMKRNPLVKDYFFKPLKDEDLKIIKSLLMN